MQIACLADISATTCTFTTPAKEKKTHQLSELRAVISLCVS